MKDVVIPDGWTLEPYSPTSKDLYVLHTPEPMRYMATVDFQKRNVRSGMSTIGRCVGAKQVRGMWVELKFGGRGWKQKLVDLAIKHLREVL